MYSGALSEEPTAINDRNAFASSSSWLNTSGATLTCRPFSRAYTFFIVLRDDGDTYTRTFGTATSSSMGDDSHAVSAGCDSEPPSPKCSTRPLNGFWTSPIDDSPGMSIFSSMTARVWDFPEPWTPHTSAENGVF